MYRTAYLTYRTAYYSAVPLVRVCAAGVGSVRSWRTWHAAQGRMLSRNMLKTGRFLVKLGEIRFSQRAHSRDGYRRGARRPSRALALLRALPAIAFAGTWRKVALNVILERRWEHFELTEVLISS